MNPLEHLSRTSPRLKDAGRDGVVDGEEPFGTVVPFVATAGVPVVRPGVAGEAAAEGVDRDAGPDPTASFTTGSMRGSTFPSVVIYLAPPRFLSPDDG